MNEAFFCNKCGAQNSTGAQFCSRCGAPANPVAAPASTPGGSSAPAGSSYATPGATAMPPVQNAGASYSAGNPQYPNYMAAAAAGVRYGGFWVRVVAAIVDHIILRVVVAPVGLIFGGLGMASRMTGLPHRGIALLGGGVTFILLLFGSWLYEAFMESSSYQATLGKMIFGMKVTDLSGNRISFERATGRHFAKYLSGIILGIGYIMVGVTERKQGLHDLLAGTLVRRS
jgi:uncharacterized RDD family membrane protein YckC